MCDASTRATCVRSATYHFEQRAARDTQRVVGRKLDHEHALVLLGLRVGDDQHAARPVAVQAAHGRLGLGHRADLLRGLHEARDRLLRRRFLARRELLYIVGCADRAEHRVQIHVPYRKERHGHGDD